MNGFYKNIEDFRLENGYEIDGTWYPRVTSIVNIKAKPALYRYYAGHESFETAESMKKKSAEEGTLVHETIEAILANQPVAIPPLIKPVVQAYKDFASTHEIIPHQIETRILSKKHGYAGTIDVLAEVDGKLGVLDIKTSYAIYRDYGIQTAAYVEALHEDKTIPPLTRWILRLDQHRLCLRGCGATLREKGGNSKSRNGSNRRAYSCSHEWGEMVGDVELRELSGLDGDVKAFLAAKTLWEWEHEQWVRQILP